MDFMQALILGLIQGVTEFLPISSSGHLILPSALLGWEDQGLAFDVAVHLGTLLAVLTYFYKDVASLVQAGVQSVFQGRRDSTATLAWMVVLATIPAGLAGLIFNDFIEEHLRSALVIAVTTVAFGVLLGVADKYGSRQTDLVQITIKAALIIGCAQALALIPGTSRSGITITAALLLGFDRSSSARFSFLLSIPIILLSGGYQSLGLLGEADYDWGSLLIGVASSMLSAYACIFTFMHLIERIGMMPFVVYRLVLGAVIFAFFLS